GGDEGIVLSEQLFSADSDAVLGIVGTLNGDAGSDARWRLTLRGMDQLLDDFDFSLDERLALLRRCRQSFGREFQSTRVLDRQLGEKFRKERIAVEALLDRTKDAGSALEPGIEFLNARSARIRQIAASFDTGFQRGRLHASKHELAAAWLHMHANRLLRGAA